MDSVHPLVICYNPEEQYLNQRDGSLKHLFIAEIGDMPLATKEVPKQGGESQ
jgi:hypothetical protein